MARRIALLLSVTLAGCGLPQGKTHGRVDSGFLSSYAHLAPDAVRPDLLAWHLSGARFEGYDAVVVELPAMRRRPDDVLPSPEDRMNMALALQAEIKRALAPRFRLLETAGGEGTPVGRILKVKTAITTALLDRGDEPPVPEHHGWGEVPMRFAFECEVIDAGNARPLARMVAFDRTQWIPARTNTPWNACTRDFETWASDVRWLVQPRAGTATGAAGVSPEPVSTYTSST